MFFSGDPTTRKRVDLGGRSSKERERNVLLKQMQEDRKRRQGLRQQTAAAIKIQKFYRGRKAIETERSKVRQQFILTFGKCLENVDQDCFKPESEFLRQLLFFCTTGNKADVTILVEACRLLLRFEQVTGNIISVFGGVDYSSKRSLVDDRVNKLVFLCLKALFQERNNLQEQLLMPANGSNARAVILLETIVRLTSPDLPWACKVADSLFHRKAFNMLRCIVVSAVADLKTPKPRPSSSLEQVLFLMALLAAQSPCNCSKTDPKLSFSSQILSIPFVWRHLPYFKELFSKHGLGKYYIHHMARLPSYSSFLPDDVSSEYPGYACLLGNLLEAAGVALSEPSCSSETALDFITISTFLLEQMPATSSLAVERSIGNEDVMDEDVKGTLDRSLERQITVAIDSRFLQHLINALFRDTIKTGFQVADGLSIKEVEAVGAVSAFLHVTFNTLPLERIMTGLAYRTELVHVLWNFIKQCHASQKWPVPSRLAAYVPGEGYGWLLPLAVFCPVYKHMLMIVDNEEFYEQEKPLSLTDIKSLIVILRQALWQLLWVLPGSSSSSQKVTTDHSGYKKLSLEVIRQRVKVVTSELLSQLQDWNNRRPFTSAADFHALEAISDSFVSQALLGNTKASELLKHAPFLVPFTSRVKIFTSQLVASKHSSGAHPSLPRSRFKIRRDRILEDAFSQLSVLSEDDLKGPIRVSFVNELGVEEAGIDGGGIFKDFMENITQTAFDVQYGLFKETADHLLYPNPGSALIHEQHLQYFHFLGSLLGKAMYEGILVDIPFATFFLSKLKQKYNYLNDLPSLDPELYRHLLFLKHYTGDVSELELYFVIVNNEYGEQTEEELLPGGKDIRVTNDNVITFIHLVANHRLNYQIRNQSKYFLRGFQQLIQKEWIEMFNEHEIQLLISGSLESIDVDDLRLNAHYSGTYDPDHPVVQMFWEVLKSLSLDHQKKFLKFVTGCSRGPLLGFKYLEPKFCIQRTGGVNTTDEDLDRLPTSATCMNLLKLPPYRSKEQLRSKLMYAINAEAGFDLS